MRLRDMWKRRRARRAAIAALAPLVTDSRRRLHVIPESAWLEPYMLGYLTTLITLLAEREVGRLDTDALGLVQAEAWAKITGQSEHLIGEEVSFHSVMGNRQFREGCMNAELFFRALLGGAVAPPPGGDEDWSRAVTQSFGPEAGGVTDAVPLFMEGGALAASLWGRFFEARVHS